MFVDNYVMIKHMCGLIPTVFWLVCWLVLMLSLVVCVSLVVGYGRLQVAKTIMVATVFFLMVLFIEPIVLLS